MQSKPKSFWDEAASRAQGESVQAAWAQKPDKEKKSLRREPTGGFTPPPVHLLPTEDQLRLRLAEELDYARRLLDAMGDSLCADPTVIARHTAALQAVDIVGQMLGHVANVVRCSEPEAAVEQIGMAELKARLQRRNKL